MRMLLMILSMMIATLSLSGHAAISNANNPHTLCIPLGSLSADGVVMGAVPAPKKLYVTSAYLLNGAAIAASDTDYVIVELKQGSTIVAEIDSRAAHENGIASAGAEAMNLVTAASANIISSGTVVSVNYNETDAGTNVALTGATVCMNYWVK